MVPRFKFGQSGLRVEQQVLDSCLNYPQVDLRNWVYVLCLGLHYVPCALLLHVATVPGSGM